MPSTEVLVGELPFVGHDFSKSLYSTGPDSEQRTEQNRIESNILSNQSCATATIFFATCRALATASTSGRISTLVGAVPEIVFLEALRLTEFY